MTGETRQSAKCVFYGRVQGVGFRYTAMHIARRYDVAGYVRNTPNGSVELVVEGAPEEIDGFVAEVEGRMNGYISRKTMDRSSHVSGFKGFDITF